MIKNSAIHFPILLKFGRLEHYGPVKPASWLKLWTTGGTGHLKWQCSANYHLF